MLCSLLHAARLAILPGLIIAWLFTGTVHAAALYAIDNFDTHLLDLDAGTSEVVVNEGGSGLTFDGQGNLYAIDNGNTYLLDLVAGTSVVVINKGGNALAIVPEPSTALLLAYGLAVLAIRRRSHVR